MDDNMSTRTVVRNDVKIKKSKAKSVIKHAGIITGIVIAVGAIVFSILMILRMLNYTPAIDIDKYQAIFLTNGQVYFGKLQTVNDDYMKLTDVFYLQTKTDKASESPQPAGNASDVLLIKLGSEVHGPDDQMVINKDQVLFFEDLKNDGTVTKSIADYHKK